MGEYLMIILGTALVNNVVLAYRVDEARARLKPARYVFQQPASLGELVSGGLARPLLQRFGVANILAVDEHLRHGLLAATQSDGVVLHAVGSFAGYVLVAFLVAYVNAALLSVLSQVRVTIPGTRYVRVSGEPRRPFFIQEIPNHLFDLIRPSQPRAPPA